MWKQQRGTQEVAHNESGAYGELHMLRNGSEVSVPLTFTKTVVTYNFIVGFQAIKFSTFT